MLFAGLLPSGVILEMYNTRFNPSASGPLHLGHVYMALVNESMARESGGRFIVRWDDSHSLYIANFGKDKIFLIRQGQRDDLEWLGLKPDAWINQSDVIEDVRKRIAGKVNVFADENPTTYPELIGDDYTPLYPFTPMLTAEKVIMDNDEGVNMLVRGIDLLSEYSLYQYYCKLFGLSSPEHIYLPRLKWAHGDMSKTFGSQSISDLRYSGYTPGQVRDMVGKACLRNAPNGWTLRNLMGEPRL